MTANGTRTLGKSKLFKLREWLTPPETAKYLSVVLGEEVAEADVLRLALDGHLTLSFHFLNPAEALAGYVIPYIKGARVIFCYFPSNGEGGSVYIYASPDMPPDELQKYLDYPVDEKGVERQIPRIEEVSKEIWECFESHTLRAAPLSDRKAEEIRQCLLNRSMLMASPINTNKMVFFPQIDWAPPEGVHDLYLVGAGRDFVESNYQKLAGGPPVEIHSSSPVFVGNVGGEPLQPIYQLIQNNLSDCGTIVIRMSTLHDFEKRLAAEEPGSLLQASEQETKPSKHTGGVTVELPHTTKALDAVFQVMRNNWGATCYNLSNPPKQTNIAYAIDTAIGWGNKGDTSKEPSRNAKAIASIIKPELPEDTNA